MFANEYSIHVGDRVYDYTPAKKAETTYKLVCSFVGPYRVLELWDTKVDVKLTSKPFAKPIWVPLSRVRLSLTEISNWFQLSNNDTNTNNGTEDIEVFAADENAEKLEWSKEANIAEQAQAKE